MQSDFSDEFREWGTIQLVLFWSVNHVLKLGHYHLPCSRNGWRYTFFHFVWLWIGYGTYDFGIIEQKQTPVWFTFTEGSTLHL